MKSYKITDVKKFMGLLFANPTFDEYTLVEGTIKTFCTFNIDGDFEPKFFGEEAEGMSAERYSKWKRLRPLCTEIIKGHNTPLFMKFVFRIKPSQVPSFENDGSVESLLFNVRYDDNTLSITSAINKSVFTMNKDTDAQWDAIAHTFLVKAGIGFEE